MNKNKIIKYAIYEYVTVSDEGNEVVDQWSWFHGVFQTYEEAVIKINSTPHTEEDTAFEIKKIWSDK
jgi:hypothetical protein